MTLNVKKRIIAGLKKKWLRKGGDFALFPIYVEEWMRSFTSVNKKKLDKLMAQQGCSCFYCKRTMEIGKGSRKSLRPTFDHKVLQSQGGTYSLSNIVAACSECNGLRNNMSFEEFSSMMAEHGFKETRRIIISERSKVKALNDAARKRKSKERRKLHTFFLAYLMFCLDRLERPWYPASIVEAQTAAKEAIKRDRQLVAA